MENFGYVVAEKKLVDEHLKVLFMYRESEENYDSGWRFFAGDGSKDYPDDPDNYAIYDIDSILAVDEGVRPYLSYPAGSVFERNDDGTFRLVSSGFVR